MASFKKALVSAIAFATIALGASQGQAANLILNGSFETGDFTDWTLVLDQSFTGVVEGCVGTICPTNGTHMAAFGQVFGPGGITQDVSTIVGKTYDFSFDIANGGGS